ncbi:MAG: hypothetical protein QFB86_01375 [Patescibacteria group bacterium]|nr:hypothetical protein [Patescibacteria group bacterium]
MATSLSTGNGSGLQTSTQSPQTSSGATDTSAAKGGSVQPGTATDLLNSDKSGVSLQNKPLSIVTLGTRQAQVSQFTPPPQKHTNPLAYGASGVLLLIAVVMVVLTARAAKNTTEE